MGFFDHMGECSLTSARTANPVRTSACFGVNRGFRRDGVTGESRLFPGLVAIHPYSILKEGPGWNPRPSQDREVGLTGLSYAAFSSRMSFRIFS